MKDYMAICEKCTCSVEDCLLQKNCPIRKTKMEKRNKIARISGHFVGGLIFQTPFLFLLMKLLG